MGPNTVPDGPDDVRPSMFRIAPLLRLMTKRSIVSSSIRVPVPTPSIAFRSARFLSQARVSSTTLERFKTLSRPLPSPVLALITARLRATTSFSPHRAVRPPTTAQSISTMSLTVVSYRDRRRRFRVTLEGEINFWDNSSAGSATVIADTGSGVGGLMNFMTSASADNATLIANYGGTFIFSHKSSGGTGRVILTAMANSF